MKTHAFNLNLIFIIITVNQIKCQNTKPDQDGHQDGGLGNYDFEETFDRLSITYRL